MSHRALNLFPEINAFFLRRCASDPSSSTPLLLALSGGGDSLFLFYALLQLRDKYAIPFHAAHVDHRWRKESRQEAEKLQQLAADYQVPFHLKVLDPVALKGNLEEVCRRERYLFFKELMEKTFFQGLVTGHHRDDLGETVLKRILEGAHWSRWEAIKAESVIDGIRIMRPLLRRSKAEIAAAIPQNSILPFDDSSNRDVRFLRARMRESILPGLSQVFGKDVIGSLVAIGQDAGELTSYFDERLRPLLEGEVEGPFGCMLDLQEKMPSGVLEIKYLLRLICKERRFFLSRELVAQGATALVLGKANHLLTMGEQKIWVDRKRLFMLNHSSLHEFEEKQETILVPGESVCGRWRVNVSDAFYRKENCNWKNAWRGSLAAYLPKGDYRIGFKAADSSLRKKWSHEKVPAFFYPYLPSIWNEQAICCDFFTGKLSPSLSVGEACWRIELKIG